MEGKGVGKGGDKGEREKGFEKGKSGLGDCGYICLCLGMMEWILSDSY